MSEVVQVPTRIPVDIKNQGKQRLMLVKNAALDTEKIIRMVKASVHPAGGSCNTRTLIRILGVIPSIQTAVLGGGFLDGDS